MSPSDDEHFDDDRLSLLYRQGAGQQRPSAAVDEAIRNAARAGLRKRGSGIWLGGLATAAVAVLSVSVLLRTAEQGTAPMYDDAGLAPVRESVPPPAPVATPPPPQVVRARPVPAVVPPIAKDSARPGASVPAKGRPMVGGDLKNDRSTKQIVRRSEVKAPRRKEARATRRKGAGDAPSPTIAPASLGGSRVKRESRSAPVKNAKVESGLLTPSPTPARTAPGRDARLAPREAAKKRAVEIGRVEEPVRVAPQRQQSLPRESHEISPMSNDLVAPPVQDRRPAGGADQDRRIELRLRRAESERAAAYRRRQCGFPDILRAADMVRWRSTWRGLPPRDPRKACLREAFKARFSMEIDAPAPPAVRMAPAQAD